MLLIVGNQTLHILGLKDEVSFGEEERKYSKGKSNPYRITQVHTNGTVTIAQGVKHQTISIRNIEPYFTK